MAGRPRKPENDKRENFLRIRLTDAERARPYEAAKAKELDTSTWARSELLQLARRILSGSSCVRLPRLLHLLESGKAREPPWPMPSLSAVSGAAVAFPYQMSDAALVTLGTGAL